MSGTVLENLSGKKLITLVLLLVLCQIAIFLVGGIVAPTPASVEIVLATVCSDTPGSHNDTSVWIYSRGDGACTPLIDYDLFQNHDYRMANQIVFVFQMPLPREGQILDYSRWQQYLIGMLHTDRIYNSHVSVEQHTTITIDARLAYRDKNDKANDWKYLASSLEERELDCSSNNLTDGIMYSCSTIPVFELGSLHHDFYLLNLRLPVDSDRKMNLDIGHLRDIHLTVIHQNGGFTMVWVVLKMVLFIFVLSIMIWFWKRVHILQRDPALIEYMLIYVGTSLTFLNLPLEMLTIYVDMPFMLLLSDIRQGIFYAILLSFWLVFAGEHMMIQETGKRSSIKYYWKHLSAVFIGCLSLFIFDMCERGVKLRNPFFSIWVSKFGANIAFIFITIGAISAALYFIFLCYMISKVFHNISLKRISLPSMSVVRRLHYEGIIYRFKFLMFTTIVCAGFTISGFILGQMTDVQWKWNDNIELEFSSAFFTGVYGMWNIYIFALLVFYAPSHKQWPVDQSTENIVSDEIEFSNLPSDSNISEVSSLTKLVNKAALD